MSVSLYPGVHLSADDDAALRRVIGLAIRCGDSDTAAVLERFLPEHTHRWSLENEAAGLAAPSIQISVGTV